jgi:F-type H+-transporting ATPase subunit b
MKRSIAAAALAAAAFFPSAAMAAEEAEGGGSWLTLLFFAINFTIFAFVLVYAAGPLLRKYFTDRAATIHSNLARSEEALHRAEALAREAAARIAALEDEVAKLKADLEEETNFQLRRVSELARSNSERIRRDAEITAAAMGENAQRRVRLHLADVAARLAHDLISRHFESADQLRLIDGFMERLGQEAQR